MTAYRAEDKRAALAAAAELMTRFAHRAETPAELTGWTMTAAGELLRWLDDTATQVPVQPEGYLTPGVDFRSPDAPTAPLPTVNSVRERRPGWRADS